MKLRGWTILWTVLGVAAAGVACVWALIHFNLLPVSTELWMDLYSGNLELHRTCAGITMRVDSWRNFSAGRAPGGNLAAYTDPEGRTEWVRVATMKTRPRRAFEFPPYMYVDELNTEDASEMAICLVELIQVANQINNDPRPGFSYIPSEGYSTGAKHELLLNCLEVLRRTRRADQINKYYHHTVATLHALDRKAYPDDLPDVDEFLQMQEDASR